MIGRPSQLHPGESDEAVSGDGYIDKLVKLAGKGSGGSRILYGRVARWPKKHFKAHSAEKIFLGPSRGSGGMPPKKFLKLNAPDWLKMHFWQLRGVKFQVKFLLFVRVIALSIIIGIFPAKKNFFRELWGVASHPVHPPKSATGKRTGYHGMTESLSRVGYELCNDILNTVC